MTTPTPCFEGIIPLPCELVSDPMKITFGGIGIFMFDSNIRIIVLLCGNTWADVCSLVWADDVLHGYEDVGGPTLKSLAVVDRQMLTVSGS